MADLDSAYNAAKEVFESREPHLRLHAPRLAAPATDAFVSYRAARLLTRGGHAGSESRYRRLDAALGAAPPLTGADKWEKLARWNYLAGHARNCFGCATELARAWPLGGDGKAQFEFFKSHELGALADLVEMASAIRAASPAAAPKAKAAATTRPADFRPAEAARILAGNRRSEAASA